MLAVPVRHPFARRSSVCLEDLARATLLQLPDTLPDDPSPEQVDAWLELAGLVADPDFQRRVREIVLAGSVAQPPTAGLDNLAAIERLGQAVADGVDPASASGQALLDELVPAGVSKAEREHLITQGETFTDERVERYWQLIGVLNGRPPFPPRVPSYRWLIAALRAHG